MLAQAVLMVCAQAFLVQTVFSTCAGSTSYGCGSCNGMAGGYSTGQSGGCGAGQSRGYSTGQSCGYSSGPSCGYSAGQSGGYSAGQSCGYSAGPSCGYSTGPSCVYSSGQSGGYSAGQSCGYSTGQSGGYNSGCGASGVASTGGGFTVSSSSPIAPTGITVLSENVYEGHLSAGGNLPFLGSVVVEGMLDTTGNGAVSYGCGDGDIGVGDEGPMFTGVVTPGAIFPPNSPSPASYTIVEGLTLDDGVSGYARGSASGCGHSGAGNNRGQGCSCSTCY